MASERPVLFEGLEPVAVAVVKARVGDDSTAERIDGPKPDGRSSKKRPGRPRGGGGGRVTAKKPAKKAKDKSSNGGGVKGKKYRPSDVQWLATVACFRPLWELALSYDALIDAPSDRRRPGWPRTYGTFDVLLFEVAAWAYGSYELVSDNLADLLNWNRLRAAVAAAYPDDPRMRLSVEPMTRSKHYRFRQRYLTDHLLETMHRIIDAAAVTAAQQMGMLVPGLGSLTDPDTRSYVTADGCWVPALTSLTSDDIAVDPDTGEVFCRRFDPDALAYHTNDGERASSPGHLLVMVQTRNPYVKERVILAARHKSARNPQMPRNDATIAVDAVLKLAARFPELRAGLRGLVYDMALSAADFDRLLDAGLIPVSKVPLTRTGRYAVANLGEHTFRTGSGASVARIVHAVNGTPCIVVTDGDGIDYYLPLALVQVKHDDRKRRPLIATRWAVTTHSLAPAGLSGATTRIRHTRTAAERAAGKSRSRAMRIFPESDARFGEVFGLRQDSESTNSDTKNRLWNRRCRTMGHNSVELNAVSYQVHTLVTALLAYHNRTGADLTAWFGQHPLPRKGRQDLAQAA